MANRYFVTPLPDPGPRELRGDVAHHLGKVLRVRAGDTVVLAGKGHESYQVIGTEKQPFDEAEIARDALRELGVL